MKNDKITITPLGTVSTYCLDEKNCPGFLVRYKKNKILLDCGNGISRYLKLPEDLEEMTIIISLLHSDHYGELLSLAQTSFVFKRLGILKNKIKVYIPDCPEAIDYKFLTEPNEESYLEFIPFKESLILHFDDLKVSFKRNPHSIPTYSIKLENPQTKIVYSSDTGYDGNTLIDFAKEADLLVCESTFLKGQTKSIDHHLYAYEAGMIAYKAKVKYLLLTHFWPTIKKEEYVVEAKEYFLNTDAAIEGKSITL